ncbi:MAG: exosortase-dependent surface protein XDP2 [Planctomycetota bacterium]|nr:exosortase-dependent surface protein XDP2 [Planctomycetota bacterium]
MSNLKNSTTSVRVASICALALTAGSALAAPTFRATDAANTTSVLHASNRELTKMSFVGATNTFNGSNFLKFADGTLTNNAGTYGWNTPIPRDVNSNNNYSGNPDRADAATPFLGEAGKTGTLKEVFGAFNGYKNMSYIIDGEDTAAWTLDLLFTPGMLISADNDTKTVELAILERGGNSDLRVFGINDDGSLTSSFMMYRASTGKTGWTLDTLEISGAQNVVGVGISLDSSWTNLKGFRFQAANGMDGPDLVAVGVGQTFMIPTPGSLALVGLGGLVAGRRRR